MAEDSNKQNKRDGRGFYGDPATHAKAGRKGGQATARQHGPEFYSEIGQRGGRASSGSFQKGSERARNAGRKGGSKSRPSQAA
ncbi:general stress protein [Candidatus Parcubacteria bacterium]|nr:general stress protein [Candidatus Parcubacteria bacterium]